MKRKTGYYWVIPKGFKKYEVAFFMGNDLWQVMATDEIFSDSDFSEIDERRIIRQEKIHY